MKWIAATRLFLGAVLLTSALRGAAYAPAATAAIDWTPNVASGVGVPGGIPARATIYATITATGDTTDRKVEIQNALAACPDGQTVLLGPGEFWISYGEFTSGINNATLRGSGTSEATGTIIKSLAGGNGVLIRGSESYNSPYGGNVTGSPVKGDTVLSVTNAAQAIVGRLAHIRTQNDETLPVAATGGGDYYKGQTVLITAVNTGAGTITIQPALYQTPVKRDGGAALAMKWQMHNDGNARISGFGIEDLMIDCTVADSQSALRFDGAHGSWARNVKVKGFDRYGIFVQESCQVEIRGCWIDENNNADWVGGSHAGISISAISACLFEDNVILKNFPLIESQGGYASGCVFGYNFGLQYGNLVAFSNHGVGNHCNLWEGNSASGWFHDGYFGSMSDDVLFRNDWHGVIFGSAIPGYPVFIGRLGRRIEVVGNQLGRAGTTLNIKTNAKTPFNEGTVGTANNYAADPHVDSTLVGTLTTRTNDTDGVITMNATLGSLGLGSPYVDDIGAIGIEWGPAGARTTRGGSTRGSVNVGALTVAFSGGFPPPIYPALPAVGTTVYVFTGPNGWLESDLANEATLVRLSNYQYSSGSLDVPPGATTLPASLYRASKPDFLAASSWPVYGPEAPDPRYEAIAAGARYVAGNNFVAAPVFSPAAGEFATAQNVTITSATAGATIHFTVDKSTPTTGSATYSAAVSVAVSPATTLKAIAVKSGMVNSTVTTGTYSQTAGPAGNPTKRDPSTRYPRGHIPNEEEQ